MLTREEAAEAGPIHVLRGKHHCCLLQLRGHLRHGMNCSV